ncbi:MAG: peptide deformylase [Candidatus Delongbacteria bacterium]|jgi:peptide deformylase|nr:peptide deformylase [Candidatus Delongbacteria bacterium]
MNLLNKLILITLAIAVSTVAWGQQQIELNFDLDQPDNQLRLDSILTENLTDGGDTMIYYPNSILLLNVSSGIEAQEMINKSGLIVNDAYPNPTSNQTHVGIYTPEKEVHVRVLDVTGRKLYEQSFKTDKGLYVLNFTPGAQSHYTLSIRSGNQVRTIQILSSNKNNVMNLEMQQQPELRLTKSVKNNNFSFSPGDELRFTAYSTACSNVETDVITDQPTDSAQYTFDFTWLTDFQPAPPEDATFVVSDTSVLMEWSEVENCNGYKYNTENNYNEATDLDTVKHVLFDDCDEGTEHELYAWAYNDCGASYPLHMQYTTTTRFSIAENELIESGTATQKMDLMIFYEQPDSIILRNTSTNVVLDEENLQLLTDRMEKTVHAEGGVGIAAPQIGINRRVIWVQRWDIGAVIHPWEVYYNPRIIQYSDSIVERADGCLSIPTGEGYPDIEDFSYRATWVDIEYYDAEGNRVVERIDHQYTAHIFQHEIDHLNGVVFLDRQLLEDKEKFTIVEGDSFEGLPPME